MGAGEGVLGLAVAAGGGDNELAFGVAGGD